MTANELLALVVPGDRVDGLVDERTTGSEGSLCRRGGAGRGGAGRQNAPFTSSCGCPFTLFTDGLEGDDEAWLALHFEEGRCSISASLKVNLNICLTLNVSFFPGV